MRTVTYRDGVYRIESEPESDFWAVVAPGDEDDEPWEAWTLSRLSMASAPAVRTGRSSRLYTTSVVLELECPASRAISSTGTPELDISDTNE